tara:strand:- start:409 stop:513 length:105 start_codon:yes stop_codon:yes gene_type:complete
VVAVVVELIMVVAVEAVVLSLQLDNHSLHHRMLL